MSVLPVGFASASGVDVGDIGHSLRFRRAASAYLSRTFGVVGNTKVMALSCFVKRGSQGVLQTIKDAYLTNNNIECALEFQANDTLRFFSYNGAYQFQCATTAVFRDPTASLHIVIAIDTTQATNSDGIKIWVNGVQQTLTFSNYTQNANVVWNTNTTVSMIGRQYGGSYFDGYLSRVCFVDGQALTPSSFGYLNTEINEWVTKTQAQVKAVVDAGGTNSFMLDFDDPNFATYNVGKDFSSKNNHWTPTNISLTAGPTYDWMLDVPGNSYATLNPLDSFATGGVTLSNANLKVRLDRTGYNCWARAGFAIPSSGKWYFEWTPTAVNVGTTPYFAAGVVASDASRSTQSDSISDKRVIRVDNGNKLSSGFTGTTYGASTSTLPGTDVFMCAIDMDSGNIYFGKNGQWANGTGSYNQAFSGAAAAFSDLISSGKTWMPFVYICYGQSWSEGEVNYGQRPLSHQPTGHKALCTANLPDPAILNPELHHNVVLATGANIKTTSEAVYPSNFLEWIKDRANANNHQLIDTVRGSSAVLQSNTTAAETTYTAPSGNSVGWAWKAGGAAVTNNAGSISSQVSANVLAGQSVVTYTGTGVNATVGHGLASAPELIIHKNRNVAYDWPVWHKALLGTEYLMLNTTAAKATDTTFWNSSTPTTTTFPLGTDAKANYNQQVALCFHSVPGYSKIGSYTGNGSADGPYVECGFKPKFVMVKRSDSTGSWQVFDSIRAGYNVDNDQLVANTSAAEVTTDLLDLTANGFKLRSTSTEVNASSGTYIFYAVADVPAKYSLAR